MEVILPCRAMECCAVIVAGFGFRQSATVESLKNALAQADWAGKIDYISTLSDKADLEIFRSLANQLNAKIVSCDQKDVELQDTEIKSKKSQIYKNSGSVSEAVALIAAGRGARVMSERFVSDDRLATCVLACGAGKEWDA